MGLGWVWWHAWGSLVARDAAALLRGRRGTWWRPLALSRGKRDTWWHQPSFRVAGVALMGLGWVGDTLGAPWSHVTPRHFCVAGAALGDVHLHLCVASVTLGDINLRFAWHAWHLWDWAGLVTRLGPLGRAWRRGTFAWQARHLVTSTCTHHSVWHSVTSWWHQPSFHTHGTRGTLSHTSLSHTTLSHTIFVTQLCHTPTLSHTALSHTLFVAHHHSHTTLSHTIFYTQLHTATLSHIFFTHHFSHTSLSHTICHTPSLSHTIFVSHHLSHTTLYHTIFHTHLCHTSSFTHHLCHAQSFTRHFVAHPFTHNFVTPQLCHTPSFTHIFHTQLCHTPSLSRTIFHTPSLSTSLIYPSFPIPLDPLFLLIGRSWLVGWPDPLLAIFVAIFINSRF